MREVGPLELANPFRVADEGTVRGVGEEGV